MKEKIFGVRKNVFFLGLVSFFNDFSSEMAQSVMPIFLTVFLGAPPFFVGLIEGVADALSSIFKLVSGWVSDKIDKRKKPAVLGYSLSVLTRFFLAFATNFWQVFALRIIDRMGKGIRNSPRDALIVESSAKEELGKSFNFHRMMDTMGAMFGPLAGLAILSVFGGSYRILFMATFFFGILAVASFIFVKEQKKIETAGTKTKKKHKLNWKIFKEHKKFIFIVGSLFVLGLGALPIGLILLKAKDVGSAQSVPLMYFLYSFTFVVAAIPIGKLSDKIGEKIVISGGFLIAALSYLGLAFANQVIVVAMFFMMLGIYSACTDGIQRVLAAKFLHEDLIATGQGFLNMALGFSSLGAGIIGGLLWTFSSSSAAFFYASMTSATGLILFFIIFKRNIKI